MNLKNIFEEHIQNNNTIVTSASQGTSSFLLYIANFLSINNNVLFYDVDRNINRDFIKINYSNAYNYTTFLNSNFSDFSNILTSNLIENYQYLIIDPCDSFLSNQKYFINVIKYLKIKNIKIIASSQIRINISEGGSTYSTLERFNLKNNIHQLFNKSIWIRNVTDEDSLSIKKYIDVFDEARKGNNFTTRYIASYTKEGRILDS